MKIDNNSSEISQHLIENFKNGSEEAFEIIVEYYKKTIYMITSKYLKNKHDADDVMQNIFIKLWKNIGLYDERKGYFVTWFVRLAYNEIKSFLRKKNRYQKRVISDIDFIYKQTVESTVAIEYDVIQLSKILSEEQYFFLIARTIYGLSNSELADIVSISKYNCKKQYNMILKKVQEYINKIN